MQNENQDVQENKPVEQVQIRVGFEAALDTLHPNWRTELSPGQVDVLRAMYSMALRDAAVFQQGVIASANAMIEGMQFLTSNVQTTAHADKASAA